MKKLFLDDVRKPPDSTWDAVRSYDAFVEYIKANGLPDVISFDHDLAFEHYPFNQQDPLTDTIPYHIYKEKTGYDCAKWLLENGYELKDWRVHSFNPVGRENIIKLLSNPRNYDRQEKKAASCLRTEHTE